MYLHEIDIKTPNPSRGKESRPSHDYHVHWNSVLMIRDLVAEEIGNDLIVYKHTGALQCCQTEPFVEFNRTALEVDR